MIFSSGRPGIFFKSIFILFSSLSLSGSKLLTNGSIIDIWYAHSFFRLSISNLACSNWFFFAFLYFGCSSIGIDTLLYISIQSLIIFSTLYTLIFGYFSANKLLCVFLPENFVPIKHNLIGIWSKVYFSFNSSRIFSSKNSSWLCNRGCVPPLLLKFTWSKFWSCFMTILGSSDGSISCFSSSFIISLVINFEIIGALLSNCGKDSFKSMFFFSSNFLSYFIFM